MELFLNLLWVALALATLFAWRAQAVDQPGRPSLAVWRQWTAFSCAAVLAFFVISMSDDLRAEYPLFDESSIARRQSVHMDSQHGDSSDSAHRGGATFAILTDGPRVFASSRGELLPPVQTVSQRSLAVVSTSGRSPPLFLF
jgi:hypothetical protein